MCSFVARPFKSKTAFHMYTHTQTHKHTHTDTHTHTHTSTHTHTQAHTHKQTFFRFYPNQPKSLLQSLMFVHSSSPSTLLPKLLHCDSLALKQPCFENEYGNNKWSLLIQSTPLRITLVLHSTEEAIDKTKKISWTENQKHSSLIIVIRSWFFDASVLMWSVF